MSFDRDKEIKAFKAHQRLKPYMPDSQWQAVRTYMRGEDAGFYIEKMIELDEIIRRMPRTYDTSKQSHPITWLRYFNPKGAGTWWITEMDKGAPEDTPDTMLSQCYGRAKIYESEMGYISIHELVRNGCELDFYHDPSLLDPVEIDDALKQLLAEL